VCEKVLPKPVENKWKMSFRWLIQGVTTYSQVFQKYLAPWTHKACMVNQSQKTCVQVPGKSPYRTSPPGPESCYRLNPAGNSTCGKHATKLQRKVLRSSPWAHHSSRQAVRRSYPTRAERSTQELFELPFILESKRRKELPAASAVMVPPTWAIAIAIAGSGQRLDL